MQQRSKAGTGTCDSLRHGRRSPNMVLGQNGGQMLMNPYCAFDPPWEVASVTISCIRQDHGAMGVQRCIGM
ncbi:hypothetical protein CRENBAI_025514 [Crenichthys baileyi]|uniref:Uncharacterized protein n=1 Tax=Crenichthys baileyi TaxID=28760 RepID=A0AAV9RW69_9TELE